ncbi:hypothetical protein, partial [Phaeobacter italicus]|uniref:hypothetical protein n=1 Tax=Phaeobacter italicus TaxID=481446 RepID=UPI00248D6136
MRANTNTLNRMMNRNLPTFRKSMKATQTSTRWVSGIIAFVFIVSQVAWMTPEVEASNAGTSSAATGAVLP